MPRLLPALCAILLLLAFGVAEGLWTDRWGLSPELAQAAGKLELVPKTVGPWEGQDMELDPRVVRQAELRAYLYRRYSDRLTGESLNVLLVCGRPGPITVHGPEVCYPGAGFNPSQPRARHEVEGLSGPAELWSERFQKAGPIPEQLQLYYGWNPGDGWAAAEKPRWAYARARALYKLYVVRHLPRADETADQDPVPGFLKLFVPAVDRCLAANPTTEGR